MFMFTFMLRACLHICYPSSLHASKCSGQIKVNTCICNVLDKKFCYIYCICLILGENKIKKKIKFFRLLSLLPLAFFYIHPIYAAENFPVEFFSSNNDHEISLRQAFARLTGSPQTELQKNIITIMQHNKMEQGNFEPVLGTYQMSTDKKITGDNTEIYYTSPFQSIPDKKIFQIASELANILDQDSIAVFKPSKAASIGEVKIYFDKNKPAIDEIVTQIKQKLPSYYSQAFSLQLNHTCDGYEKTTVNSVEWMGSHLDVQLIKQAFSQQTATTQNGIPYLVYKNGKIDKL